MANKADRADSKYRQTHYRPRYYMALKVGAWAALFMLALCILAAVVA